MTSAQIDVARARRETPGAKARLHFNNAGASLMPQVVLDTLVGHLEREAMIGGYEASAEAAPRLEAMYGSLARLINARPDEIAFIENATRAWDMAFYAVDFTPGDRILTAQSEYGSNVIAYLQMARRKGVVIDIVPNDETGQLSVQALESMIDERVRLISVTHAPTQGGLINPAAAIGAIARAHGIPFLLDACQSVGQIPIDVAAIGCDMLSATGRKFLRGPRGTGFLYVRREWIGRLDPPFLDGHAAAWTSPDTYEVRPDARRFENWESYVAGRLGLGAAADYAMSWGIEAISARSLGLAARLREALGAVSGVEVHDQGLHKSAIVTFTKAGVGAEVIKAKLKDGGVNVSVTERAWAQWDFGQRGIAEVVRASPHYFNADEDIERFAAAIAAC
jgi:selenocysteine lyase/cysteine desulfurase